MLASIFLGTSIILSTAVTTGQTCNDVFKTLATEAYPVSRSASEMAYLEELARAACETPNPDIVWEIVGVESSFRFEIVRINNTQQVLQGKDALKFLKNMKKEAQFTNVDIGAMQINWRWHGDNFAKNPKKMMAPAQQVEYLFSSFAPYLMKQCEKRWIGCYHNASDLAKAEIYESRIQKSRRILIKAANDYLSNPESLSQFRALT